MTVVNRKLEIIKEVHMLAQLKVCLRQQHHLEVILADKKLNWGPPVLPDKQQHKPMKGGCKHYGITFIVGNNPNAANNLTAVVTDPRQKNAPIIPLLDFIQHKGMRTQGARNLAFLIRQEGYNPMNAMDTVNEDGVYQPATMKIELLQGLKITSSKESQLGVHNIHATTDFNRTGKSRHDFVEVDVEVEDTTGEIVKQKQLAQVIFFLRLSPTDKNIKTSRTYALLQFLEEETISPDKKKKKSTGTEKFKKHKSIFKKYKWEKTTHNGEVGVHPILSIGLMRVSSITQPVWIAPDFASMGLGTNLGIRSGYQNVAMTNDRYWHVPRTFTDKSGWNDQLEVLPGGWDTAATEDDLLHLLIENQTTRGARMNEMYRQYDVEEVNVEEVDGEDDGVDEDEEEAGAEDGGDEDDLNDRIGMIRVPRNASSNQIEMWLRGYE
jgi:hypothetical protein